MLNKPSILQILFKQKSGACNDSKKLMQFIIEN
jgi:hypothetical protein